MENTAVQISKPWLWVWRIIMVIIILFLAFDGISHILKPHQVVETFAAMGLPIGISVAIGIIELFFLVLYCIPQTMVLGAVLMTGYLGGAVLANIIANTSVFGNILFPVYIGVLLWGSVYMLDQNVRMILPYKK